MKMRILTVLAALALSSNSFAATGGSDNASDVVYNDGLGSGDNGGSGFNAWVIAPAGNGGTFILSSVGQGFGNVDTTGEAFGFYGNTTGGDGVNADRTFAGGALTIGQSFSIDLAINFRNGNKGIDLDVGGAGVWNFNTGGDLYTVNGVDLGWVFSSTSVFELTVTATGVASYDISLVRGTDTFNQSYANGGSGIDGFGLYEFGTEAGDSNNLFANNLEVVPEPSTMVMALMGAIGLVAARRRLQK